MVRRPRRKHGLGFLPERVGHLLALRAVEEFEGKEGGGALVLAHLGGLLDLARVALRHPHEQRRRAQLARRRRVVGADDGARRRLRAAVAQVEPAIAGDGGGRHRALGAVGAHRLRRRHVAESRPGRLPRFRRLQPRVLREHFPPAHLLVRHRRGRAAAAARRVRGQLLGRRPTRLPSDAQQRARHAKRDRRRQRRARPTRRRRR